jgi:hypothetical protein
MYVYRVKVMKSLLNYRNVYKLRRRFSVEPIFRYEMTRTVQGATRHITFLITFALIPFLMQIRIKQIQNNVSLY